MARDSQFAPSGFFVLRTPLLPFDDLLRWEEGAAGDRRVLRDRLRELVEHPEVREAIAVASPAVDDLIPGWLSEPESDRGRQCERALVRYVSRMAGRSTPFGLFAGVSTGTVGSETSLSLAPRSRYRRTTRLDAGYLVEVVDRLLAEPERREDVTYRPNPSLYRCGGRRRYFRSRPAADEERHRLISVRESAALEAALDAASAGATPSELRARLVAPGHEEGRVARFVDELIEQQVLIPDLGLDVTGSDATFGLAASVPALAAVAAELSALDALALGDQPDGYRRIEGAMPDLGVPAKPGAVFQVDMTKEATTATLGEAVTRELLRGVELLRRLTPSRQPPALRRFVERLEARHEGEPVPLLEALDPDLGVGFGDEEAAPSPLLADLAVRPSRRPSEWGPRESRLLDLLLEAQTTGAQELVLDDADVEKLSVEEAPQLPDAFAAVAVVAAPSDAALAAGRFRVLVLGADGPSGARLLGRFCHADPSLGAAVERHLRAEEALDPEAVFAEIVHLPRARDVNVVARPVLRDYELPCITGSGAPPDRQIPLSDLLVATRGGEAVLYSARLGRRVVPRLTSAHNFGARGMSAYRFLCALQDRAGRQELGFWGPLARAPFLPRVRSGRVVLSAARWRLEAGELDESGRGLHGWRRALDVPRFVALDDYGGQTPVDLDNSLATDSLEQIVRSRGSVTLVELFPPPDELCVDGPEGRFVHELVVPFVRGRPAVVGRSGPPAEQATRRRFRPGGEWLYLRLYTGETLADEVLRDGIAPLVREAIDNDQADRWFFLRYRDPEFHLRLRLHGDPAVLNEAVRPRFEQLAGDVVWRTELGTYQREVERYGGPEAIEAAEAVFHADSEAVLAILPLLEPGEAGLEECWQLGVAGADLLLADLGLDEAERLDLVRRQRDGLARNLRWDDAALGRVGARFRRERARLAGLLDAAPQDGHPLEPGLEILRQRSARLAPAADHLQHLHRGGRLVVGWPELAASLLHMHLNRLLRGDNAAQELVICDFLARLYAARAHTSRP